MDRTIARALADAASQSDQGLTFIREDGTERSCRYAELLTSCQARAAALQEEGLRAGDNVALILPDGEDFVVTFFGAILAGIVPVPLYPPLGLGQIQGYLDSSKHIVRASQARRVITNATIRRLLGTVREAAPDCEAVLDVAELRGDAARFSAPRLTLTDTAFIQFTSGSTSRPKGVVVSHGNLAVNAHHVMHDALRVREGDVGVSWLPLFHDMGLIGKVIAPLTAQVPMVYLSTLTFLKRPQSWLEAISRHRGTISFSPNFGYGVCARRVSPDDLPGLDLSCWRVAGCGAEPIQPDTLGAFARRFAGAGFSEQAFLPCYGMAEHTLAISFAPLDRGARTDCVRSASLWEHGLAEPGDPGQDGTVGVVSCGLPLPGHEVTILDEDGTHLAERQVGEIALKGPSLMRGYHRAPQLTQLAMRDEWFLSGDLGYFADGELHVCGRKKDVIIVNGRNFHPQDIEWAIGDLEGVRVGSAVAFGTPAPDGSERVVVVAESREPAERWSALATTVQVRVHEVTGLHPADVRILPPGSVPKTTSGKLRRTETRRLYEEQRLGQREEAGKLDVLRHVARSQFSYLKATFRQGARPRRADPSS